jgi:hypothetical protein
MLEAQSADSERSAPHSPLRGSEAPTTRGASEEISSLPCPATKRSDSDGLVRRRRAVVPLKRRGPIVERINFGIVRVYLDDIQEIFSILKELTDEVRIQADDFVATEPQDLLEMSSKTINELTIVATQPSVTVTLSGKTATLEATDADTMTLGAVKRIEERMGQRRRPLKKVLWTAKDKTPGLVVAAFILGLASLVLILLLLAPEPANPPPDTATIGREWIFGIWALTLLAVPLAVIMTARRQAIVIPRPQKDAPSFWERNQDQIAINAIFTVMVQASESRQHCWCSHLDAK